MSLLKDVTDLAHANPGLRKHLVPVLRKYARTGILNFARAVATALQGHFVKHIGEFRYSDHNDSALILAHSPDHSVPVYLVISVFEDGSTRYSPYSSDSLSEIDRFENLIGINEGDIKDRGTVREMVKDIKDDLKTVDKYKASWGEEAEE